MRDASRRTHECERCATGEPLLTGLSVRTLGGLAKDVFAPSKTEGDGAADWLNAGARAWTLCPRRWQKWRSPLPQSKLLGFYPRRMSPMSARCLIRELSGPAALKNETTEQIMATSSEEKKQEACSRCFRHAVQQTGLQGGGEVLVS